MYFLLREAIYIKIIQKALLRYIENFVSALYNSNLRKICYHTPKRGFHQKSGKFHKKIGVFNHLPKYPGKIENHTIQEVRNMCKNDFRGNTISM